LIRLNRYTISAKRKQILEPLPKKWCGVAALPQG